MIEWLSDLLLNLVNAPLQPFIYAIETLLGAEPVIEPFLDVWRIIVYVLSFLYLLPILYAGGTLLVSGNDPMRRNSAKEWLKNAVLMIVLVQASYWLYGILISLSGGMVEGLLDLVDSSFLLFTFDNLLNIGFELIFGILYFIVLIITILFLAMRYMIVSLGVLLAPIGVFLYFIPPLRGYGKYVLHGLGIFAFLPIIQVLVVLACSKLVNVSLFGNFEIIIMINCLLLIDFLVMYAAKMAIGKSVSEGIKDDIRTAVKYVTMAI